MHPKSQPEEQIYVFPSSDHRCRVQSVSFIIHYLARLLSKSEVKWTTSGVVLVSIDALGRSCLKTVLIFDTSKLLLWNCRQQSGRNIYLESIVTLSFLLLPWTGNASILMSIWNLDLTP